ncbi:uncharacterized protein KZ484_016032 isoform 1-T1 [Pholidichthys leucotaenia]
MSSLSYKSAEELAELLDEFGIKHGPVVDSTRKLYEKKLKEAMAKGKRVPKSSSDKTYYREEEEEVVYVHRTPVKSEFSQERFSHKMMCTSCLACTCSRPYMRSRPEWSEREFEHQSSFSRSRPEYRGRDDVDVPYVHDTPSSYKSSYLKSPPKKTDPDPPQAPKSSRLVPLWVQFVVFLVLAFFLYLILSNMETNETLKGIE